MSYLCISLTYFNNFSEGMSHSVLHIHQVTQIVIVILFLPRGSEDLEG